MERHIGLLYWALAAIYVVAGITAWEVGEAVLAGCYGTSALTHMFIGVAHHPNAKVRSCT